MTVGANRWKLGLFVVGALAASITGLVWVGVARLKPAVHEAFVYFDESVNGLDSGSPVKFRGVPIGRVGEIVAASDEKHLMVQILLLDRQMRALQLDPEKLGADSRLRAQIVQSWVTQTSFVQVDYFPQDTSPPQELPFPVPKTTIRAVPSTIKNFEEGMREVLREVPPLLTSTRDLLDQVRGELKSASIGDLGKHAEEALAALKKRLVELDEMPVLKAAQGAFAETEKLAAALRRDDTGLPATLRELQTVGKELRLAIAAADVPATSKAIDAAATSVDAAGAEVTAAGRELRGELSHLRRALQAVERLADLLERDPGSLLHGRSGQPSPLKKE